MSLLFAVLSLSLCFSGVVGRGELVLGNPESIVDGRSLRINMDIPTGMRVHVLSIVACSAVDMPLPVDYDATRSNETGCRSFGYQSEEVYSAAIRDSPAGSLASKFRVRRRGAVIYLRRRLLDRRTPLVYLQITLRTETLVHDGGGGDTVTFMRQYYVLEKVLAINDVRIDNNNNKDEKNFLGTPIKDSGRDDQIDVAPSVPLFTRVIGFSLLASVFVVIIACMWYYDTRKRRYKIKREDNNGDYASTRKTVLTQKISDWMEAANKKGVFGSV